MNFNPQLVSNLKITKHVTTQPSKGFFFFFKNELTDQGESSQCVSVEGE